SRSPSYCASLAAMADENCKAVMFDCTKRKIATDIIPRMATASMISRSVKPRDQGRAEPIRCFRRFLKLAGAINIKLNLLGLGDACVRPTGSQRDDIDSRDECIVRLG